jgi:hypothetical protein
MTMDKGNNERQCNKREEEKKGRRSSNFENYVA